MQQARALILEDRYSGSLAECDQFLATRPLNKTLHAEVRLVNAQNEAGVRRKRNLVVGQPGPIRCADFFQQRARLRENLGDAEATANLDEFSSAIR